MNRKKSFSRLGMAGGIAVAFAVGYLGSGGSASHRGRGDGSQMGVRTGSQGAAGESGRGKVIAGKSWPDVKARVRKRWEASPAVTVDFELREETRRLLEKTPVADLEAWLRELRSDYQVDDDKDITLQLRRMILMVLAPRGAGLLIRSLAEHPTEEGEGDVDEAMSYWTKQDPAAVLAWLDGDVPQLIKEELDDRRESALVELAGKDPAEFEKRLAGVEPEMRESVLDYYACRRATAEDRSGILERAARSPHGEAMALWQGLLRGEGSEDPERAYATLAELKISAANRAALDEALVWSLLGGYYTSKEDRSGVMQGWVERNPSLLVSEDVLRSFKNWCDNDPERAVTWVAGQPSGPQRDAFAQLLNLPETAKIYSLIGDPLARAVLMGKLKKSWQAIDAAAAAEWEKTLPVEDQEQLQHPSGDLIEP